MIVEKEIILYKKSINKMVMFTKNFKKINNQLESIRAKTLCIDKIFKKIF